MSNIATNASEIKGMKLNRLSFECSNYNDKGDYTNVKRWKATASLEGSGNSSGFRSVDLKLDETIASEIMRLLMPTVVKQASDAAQAMADEAKQLAAAVGEAAIKSLPTVLD